MNGLDVEFVVTDNDELALLNRILEEEQASDVEQVSDSGFVEIVGIIVAAVVALTGLANVVVKLARLRKSGVIVDARGSVIRTTVTGDLPSGTVLVLAREGTQHEFHDVSNLEVPQLLDALAS